MNQQAKSLSSAYYAELADPFLYQNDAFAIRAEHLMRYWFAKDFLRSSKPKTIYDVACGDGYGTKLLAKSFKQLIGIDRSSEFLAYAQKNNAKNNITYRKANLDQIDFVSLLQENNLPRPDAIVCFETLEHLEHPDRLLQSFYAVLNLGGYLLVSTPNAHMEPQINGKPKDPFHKQLFDQDLLKGMVTSSGFQFMRLYGQPFTNILFHHKHLINALNTVTAHSYSLFALLSRMLAYPTTHFLVSSYSFILVAQKNK